jgi:hypothetical protein
MAAAGPVVTAVGGRWIYGIGAIAYAVAGIVGLALAPRLGSSPPTAEELLEAVPPVALPGAPVENPTA